VVLLVRASRRGTFDRRWWQVLVPLVVAGLIVGSGWRVVTAGGAPDNIGAGLVVLFGGPVVVALTLWAMGRGAWLTLHRNDRPQQVQLVDRPLHCAGQARDPSDTP
jgi:hypothetical protein